ncbi:hypothetical protein GWI33_008102 [Rhynchophorus ferrugineus]|uniref:Uncharacterized protein n=1 Tax=Rhynchophorus ferrugineus TaxID=354439 RepID=A0A834IRK4_RHYFE|nr:hypothetical protein GWI33_008102 [Rhynchophorus ferrugineus]
MKKTSDNLMGILRSHMTISARVPTRGILNNNESERFQIQSSPLNEGTPTEMASVRIENTLRFDDRDNFFLFN